MPEFPLSPEQQTDVEVLLPLSFTRHKRQLRALLLDEEPWFSVNDLSRLMNLPQLAERIQRNLDEDQVQRSWMRNSHGEFEEELLVSESGLYAVLIYFFHPENRGIRPVDNAEGDSALAQRRTLRRVAPQPPAVALAGTGAGGAALAGQGLDAAQ
ncbi:phage antirepressor [Pseudomonas resinovorans]|uniref:Phage antirepressor n=1 Tax=Metapseudomonas resinovorans TaxID=53412 RepID=A0ABT4Y2C5_METRE|nr:phage antirepressor [Pseudomonas resinovorans]MDA8482889.1 phage antirepressor [Pseudomonas resinovorans]